MSSLAAILGDLPPCINFNPNDDELVTLYLLPRVRGQPDAFPGVIVEDDSAANTQPWKLFRRHGLSDDVLQAFFYVRTANDARVGARPDRRCHGGGSWKSQKREREDAGHELLVDGKTVRWSRHNLNFNMGSGSVGWVMHEYSITGSPSLKVCRISFTGYGHKRKRAPDAIDDDSLTSGEPVPRRARVADGSASASYGDSFDDDCLAGGEPVRPPRARVADDSASASSGSGSGSTTAAFVQNSSADHQDPFLRFSKEEIVEMMDDMMKDEEMPFILPTDEEPPVQFQRQFDEARTAEQMVDKDAVPHKNSMATGTGTQTADNQDPTLLFSFSKEEIAEMMKDELPLPFILPTDEEPPFQFQQQFDEVTTTEQMVDQDAVPHTNNMATGAETQTADHQDPFSLLSSEEIAEMMKDELPFILPTDEEPPFPFQLQFDEARTTEQLVDQDAVPHMNNVATGTGTQSIVSWGGFDFV